MLIFVVFLLAPYSFDQRIAGGRHSFKCRDVLKSHQVNMLLNADSVRRDRGGEDEELGDPLPQSSGRSPHEHGGKAKRFTN